MTTPATGLEARILAALRSLRFGELRVFVHGGNITRIERVESIKAEDLPDLVPDTP